MRCVLPILLLAAALPAAAQQRIPAAEQHVTAPSAIGQGNKESLVKPGDTLRQASCGRVLQGDQAATASAPRGQARSAGAHAAAEPGASRDDVYIPPASTADSGPTGPALVEAAYLTLRGTLSTFDRGIAVTIVDRNGRSRTVPLARGARVDEGLKAGDSVAVRIPLEDDPANKTASRVERQKPPAAAPPTSKFAQAQTPPR